MHVLHELDSSFLPGFASFLDVILALDGMMNLSRNSRSGSAASREAAYSFAAAFSGKEGLVCMLMILMSDIAAIGSDSV